jgi:hypothetical protein|tara:strand:- start:19 stop:672 length:654 start_codon:yes stop_codon:yes gene_type:complete
MFTWNFHVCDDNHDERTVELSDERIDELMPRLHIESERFKEFNKKFPDYLVKNNSVYTLDDEGNVDEEPYPNDDKDHYDCCYNCGWLWSEEYAQGHLEECMPELFETKRLDEQGEVKARTLSSAYEKCVEYLKENLPIPEDDKYDLDLRMLNSDGQFCGGTLDYEIRGIDGYELRLVLSHPSYNSEEFEDWDEEELKELKIEIERNAEKQSRYIGVR